MADDDFDLIYGKGDKAFDIEATIKDAQGNAVNLSTPGYTAVNFKMWKKDAASAKVNAAGAFVDAVNGKVKYTVGATDFDTADEYLFAWIFSKAGTQVTVLKNSPTGNAPGRIKIKDIGP